MLALLLAAATPQTAVDAERAFAADAQRLGQWTAFRKWADYNAVMFDPKPVKTRDLLKDAQDPPRSVKWWPTASYVSCDGTMVVNTGGWERPDGSKGYFTTVWRKTADGWRWTVDGGDTLSAARQRPRSVAIERAACPVGVPTPPAAVEDFRPGVSAGGDSSRDHSLQYSWIVEPDGARRFQANIARKTGVERIIDDQIAAPPTTSGKP